MIGKVCDMDHCVKRVTFNSDDTERERETGTQDTHCSVLGAGFGHELADMMLPSYSQYGNFLFFKKANKQTESYKLSS